MPLKSTKCLFLSLFAVHFVTTETTIAQTSLRWWTLTLSVFPSLPLLGPFLSSPLSPAITYHHVVKQVNSSEKLCYPPKPVFCSSNGSYIKWRGEKLHLKKPRKKNHFFLPHKLKAPRYRSIALEVGKYFPGQEIYVSRTGWLLYSLMMPSVPHHILFQPSMYIDIYGIGTGVYNNGHKSICHSVQKWLVFFVSFKSPSQTENTVSWTEHSSLQH